MSVEIEAKMPLHDRDALLARLGEVGAEPRGTVHETNTFFDTARSELKATDQGLRVRVRVDASGETSCTVTHKGPRAHGKLKSRTEAECGIDSPRHMAEVFDGLGYSPTFCFEKVRQSFALDECAVEIDTLPHLGDYLEIEGPTEASVLAVRDKLGMGDVPLIRASYIAMLTAFARENHLGQDIIRFEDRPALA